jgi:hypothetical protein
VIAVEAEGAVVEQVVPPDEEPRLAAVVPVALPAAAARASLPVAAV